MYNIIIIYNVHLLIIKSLITIFYQIRFNKTPLAPMGVLAPRVNMLDGVVRLPIDTIELISEEIISEVNQIKNTYDRYIFIKYIQNAKNITFYIFIFFLLPMFSLFYYFYFTFYGVQIFCCSNFPNLNKKLINKECSQSEKF